MYSEVVVSTHLFVPKKDLKNLSAARERLTVKPKFDGEPLQIYVEEGNHFGIPLYFYRDWHKIAKKVQDVRMEGSKIKYNFTSKLRPGQLPLIQRFEKYLKSGGTGFIVEAPPGFGKTVVMIKMVQTLERSTLVVVPRSNLVRQWVDRFVEHSSLKRSQIGQVNGSTVDYHGKAVVVALVHSLAQLRGEIEFTHSFGCVVFDEVDRSVPPATFAPAVGMFPSVFRIGASATLKRSDGMHEVFENHVGQYYLKGEDVGRMKPKVLIHDYPEDSGYVHMGSAKLNRRGMLLSRVANNPDRCNVIAKYVKMIYNSGRRCVVLSDRTEQLMYLRGLVSQRYGISLDETGMYVRQVPVIGGKKRNVKQAELRKAAAESAVLFATYGMMGIGTDIPDLAGLVYATPQSHIEQSKGRIERLCEGKLQPVIVDIVDTAYSDAVKWGHARLRHYRDAGLKIKRYK